MLDAAETELVQALTDNTRVVVDGRANLAKEGCVFYLLKESQVDDSVVGDVENSRRCDRFEEV